MDLQCPIAGSCFAPAKRDMAVAKGEWLENTRTVHGSTFALDRLSSKAQRVSTHPANRDPQVPWESAAPLVSVESSTTSSLRRSTWTELGIPAQPRVGVSTAACWGIRAPCRPRSYHNRQQLSSRLTTSSRVGWECERRLSAQACARCCRSPGRGTLHMTLISHAFGLVVQHTS